MAFQFIKSKYGKHDLISQDNYIYSFDKKSFYRCVNRSCRGRGELDGNSFKTTQDHNHVVDLGKSERKKTVEKLKEAVKLFPNKNVGEIYYEIANVRKIELGRSASAYTIPPLSEIRSTLQYNRSKQRPNLPQTIEDINLPSDYSSINGVTFVSKHGNILLFAKTPTIDLLKDAQCVYMDGTFFASPKLFTQLYSLHVFVRRSNKATMICSAYVLLPDRTTETYTRMFQLLQQRCPIRALRFQVDFERPVINAINQVFPNATVSGCFFHYTQCILRKMKSNDIGLTKSFNNNTIPVVTLVRRLCVLPLVKPADIGTAFEYAKSTINNNGLHQDVRDKMKKLIAYVDKTWVGLNAKFNQDIWSRYNIDGPRTNNHVEGFHSALNDTVRNAHPHIFRFIDLIKNEQEKQEVKLMQITTAGKVTAPVKKYVDLEKRVKEEIEIYSQTSSITALRHFIDQIGYNLHI